MLSSAGGGLARSLPWSLCTTASGRGFIPGGERSSVRSFWPNPLQYNGERAALALSTAGGRDGSSMPFDDGLYNRQSESCSAWTLPFSYRTGARTCLVSAIETGEQVREVRRCYSASRIPHRHRHPFARNTLCLQPDLSAHWGIGDGILQERQKKTP